MQKTGYRLVLLALISCALWLFSRKIGLSNNQSLSIAIFSTSILGTLFFWDFRLSFAFLGTAILLVTKTIDIEHVIEFSSLEVILFLVGMMIITGFLKYSGFFAWIVSLILRIRNLTGRKFVFYIAVLSALLSCAVDEVTSIIFMVAAILEICDYFEVEPTPFLIISVFATNIGSAGTVLGNPIGILIASKSGLTFEDFIVKAFPLAMLCLLVLIFIVLFWYRPAIKNFDRKIKELGPNDILISLISVSPDRHTKTACSVFAATLCAIAVSYRFDLFWKLMPNTTLVAIPLIVAAFIMIWKWRKARAFVEKDVEWWTLLFFLMLFVQAGTLKYTDTTKILADKIITLTENNHNLLVGMTLWLSAIGSSILDNVVLVAAFVPIVQGLKIASVNLEPLWWAILFGGCLGGNITLVGSTANIVAIGILEKEKNIRITFLEWFKIGAIVGIITTAVVWLVLTVSCVYR
ncbi:MAG: SLC13 family permease [Candidatus Omnitrophica bacterium]|nr:SLC13 family permease [Candidatus Omnitrophota bacterium]